ncbi:MAG: cytochrome P450, partial [Pseudomonadota bacterium]
VQKGEKLETVDILSFLVEGSDPTTGARFSLEELVDQTAFLFLAGHETSASALSWSAYLLSMSEEVQQRLHDEVSSVTQGGPVEFSHIRELAFTRNVFREALRLYPPVGFLPREATRQEVMRDKKIKPRDVMLICPWLIHRHRLIWEKPDVFDPDRFETDNCKHAVKSHAYTPFSMGPRTCTGAGFATQEAILILASLIAAYRLEPVPGHVPEPVGRLTIRAENGIKLKLIKR